MQIDLVSGTADQPFQLHRSVHIAVAKDDKIAGYRRSITIAEPLLIDDDNIALGNAWMH